MYVCSPLNGRSIVRLITEPHTRVRVETRNFLGNSPKYCALSSRVGSQHTYGVNPCNLPKQYTYAKVGECRFMGETMRMHCHQSGRTKECVSRDCFYRKHCDKKRSTRSHYSSPSSGPWCNSDRCYSRLIDQHGVFTVTNVSLSARVATEWQAKYSPDTFITSCRLFRMSCRTKTTYHAAMPRLATPTTIQMALVLTCVCMATSTVSNGTSQMFQARLYYLKPLVTFKTKCEIVHSNLIIHVRGHTNENACRVREWRSTYTYVEFMKDHYQSSHVSVHGWCLSGWSHHYFSACLAFIRFQYHHCLCLRTRSLTSGWCNILHPNNVTHHLVTLSICNFYQLCLELHR